MNSVFGFWTGKGYVDGRGSVWQIWIVTKLFLHLFYKEYKNKIDFKNVKFYIFFKKINKDNTKWI